MSSVAVEAPIDVGALLRRLRFPAIVAVIGLGLVTLLAVIGRQPNSAPLDPRNTAPQGAHALSVLLGARGIPVSIATTTSQLATTGATTIVVSSPDQLSRSALSAVAASRAPVVLIAPSPTALRAFGADARPDALTAAADAVEPACALPAAVTAGSARISGDLYAAPTATVRCYPQQGDAALVQLVRANGGVTTVFGSPSTFTNAHLADDGDAALALGLLDNDAVQFAPGSLDTGPATGSHRGLLNLLPSRLLWATLQLFIVFVIVVLWRSRRLGAPVVEPLPVVVRAAETVEGRGRLMHAAKARGLAAHALRAATIRRVGRTLRLGSDEEPAAVVALVAERTATPSSEIQGVLYGGEPSDDAALVTLAQRLPAIETAIRQDGNHSPGGQT